MIKNILNFVTAVTLTTSIAYGKGGAGGVDELIDLPHPVKVIVINKEKLSVSKEQSKQIDEKMLGYFPQEIQSRMKQASKLEKEIKDDVLIHNKTKIELAHKINKLENLKREITDIHIDALNTLSDILTKKQMQQALSMMQKQKKMNKKFKIDELAILPHPGKLIKIGKIDATSEQKQRITKEVKSVYPPVFQDLMRKAFDLEKKLQRAVKKGKNKDDLKNLLDEIAKLKREAMDGRIDALNHIQKILTQEQWKNVNKFTYK